MARGAASRPRRRVRAPRSARAAGPRPTRRPPRRPGRTPPTFAGSCPRSPRSGAARTARRTSPAGRRACVETAATSGRSDRSSCRPVPTRSTLAPVVPQPRGHAAPPPPACACLPRRAGHRPGRASPCSASSASRPARSTAGGRLSGAWRASAISSTRPRSRSPSSPATRSAERDSPCRPHAGSPAVRWTSGRAARSPARTPARPARRARPAASHVRRDAEGACAGGCATTRSRPWRRPRPSDGVSDRTAPSRRGPRQGRCPAD